MQNEKNVILSERKRVEGSPKAFSLRSNVIDLRVNGIT